MKRDMTGIHTNDNILVVRRAERGNDTFRYYFF
jgi:hypothetical protein